jgi:hypothetical protein
MTNNKELRVYWVSEYEEFENFTPSEQEIDNWDSYQEQHPSTLLPKNASDFIERAETRGNVYSLRGFQEAYNNDMLNIGFIFITNNY